MEYKSLLHFSKRERRGIIAFVLIMALMFILARLWPMRKYIITYKSLPYSNTISSETREDESNTISSYPAISRDERFPFDPNSLSQDSFQLLGFSKAVARRIINYRSKGAVITSTAKLKKIYGIDTLLVDELEPYIQFPKKEVTEKPSTNLIKEAQNPVITETRPIKTIEKVDVNLSDSISWLNLPGIGAYRASKILSYRRRLGGFLSTEQVREVSSVPDSIHSSILQYLTISPVEIQKVDINKADYKILTQHPYISPKMANAILKYREQHGMYEKAEHISRIISISKQEGYKVLPYLKVTD
ncbi:MAG: helix-hairpin-helix domain-containing protein [Saprospiraceae bacterium]